MKKLLFFALTITTSTLIFAAQKPAFRTETVQLQQADSTDLKVYAGTYTFAKNDNFTKLTITVENGDLYGTVDANPKYKLLKQPAADTFKSTSEYGSIYTFTRDAATKQVEGFKMQIMGNEITGTKD